MADPQSPAGEAGTPDAGLHHRWRGGNLGRLVLVETADIDGDGLPEIIALAGRQLKVFDWTGDTYMLRREELLPKDGLALAVGLLAERSPTAIVVGAKDAVMLFVAGDQGIHPVCETLLYPNAYFRSVRLADVNGDGHLEIVAAASGAQTLYLFQVRTSGGEARLEELGRVYVGGIASAQGLPGGAVVTGSKDGYVDVFVSCSLLPHPTQAFHCVKRGDSLWGIARRFGVSPGAIARANRLREPYQLSPGQVLVIPPTRGQH